MATQLNEQQLQNIIDGFSAIAQNEDSSFILVAGPKGYTGMAVDVDDEPLGYEFDAATVSFMIERGLVSDIECEDDGALSGYCHESEEDFINTARAALQALKNAAQPKPTM